MFSSAESTVNNCRTARIVLQQMVLDLIAQLDASEARRNQDGARTELLLNSHESGQSEARIAWRYLYTATISGSNCRASQPLRAKPYCLAILSPSACTTNQNAGNSVAHGESKNSTELRQRKAPEVGRAVATARRGANILGISWRKIAGGVDQFRARLWRAKESF
jgi:hypothetical protein